MLTCSIISNIIKVADTKSPGIDYLEISSRSDSPLGKSLSPFNMRICINGVNNSVENFYHAMKVIDGRTGLDWREAKGKKMDAIIDPYTHFRVSPEDRFRIYHQMYQQYLDEHPEKIAGLVSYRHFSDMFGRPQSPCQCIEVGWRIGQILGINKDIMDIYAISNRLKKKYTY
jgi:hypothetical protein